jgi:hypothetical protein
VLRKQGVRMWTGLICEDGNENSGFVKEGEIFV